MGLLDGKAVVITGAGRGLGRSFAMGAAREGASVVVNDIDLDEAENVVAEIAEEGGTAIASGDSVAAWESSGAIVRTCVEEFGSLDGFVNNAIAYTFYGLPWEQDGEAIRQAVEVNITGALYCGAHALEQMVKQGSGSLVNVSSRLMMGMPGMAVYCAAKGALASATYSQAMDAMAHNVRVNALAPAGQTRGHVLGAKYAGFAKAVAESPDLCAPAAVYLLSDLSRDITGQTLVALGRKLSLMRRPEVLEKVFEQDEWATQEIADKIDSEFRDLLQPIGITGTEYEWNPVPAGAS